MIIDLVAETKIQLQELTNKVDCSSKRLGLKINVQKTKTMVVGKRHEILDVTLGGEELEQVTEFVYLGGLITEDARCTRDIKRRSTLACTLFGKLGKIWRDRNISTRTKLKIYETLVIPVLLYGSECWCLRKEDERKLLAIEMNWLRRIKRRSKRDRIKNEVTRKELGQEETVIDRIRKKRLTWLGHVMRMDNNRLPSMALYGYVEGTRSRGRQQKTWMDNIREDLQRMEMDMEEVKESIWNRESWRRRVEDSSSALA